MEGLNFKIVEVNQSPVREVESEIRKLIENNKRVCLKDLSRQFGYSIKQTKDILFNLVKDEGLKLDDVSFFTNDGRMNHSAIHENQPAKHYYFRYNRWHVRKIINNKTVYYGRFNTEKEAQDAVKLLKSLNWSKEEYEKIRKN